jgi:hypothetical protein
MTDAAGSAAASWALSVPEGRAETAATEAVVFKKERRWTDFMEGLPKTTFINTSNHIKERLLTATE